MKRVLTAALFLFVVALPCSARGLRVGGSIGYYSVADSVYKDTYGSGNLMYGVFLGHDLLRILEIRGEVSYFWDKGETTLTKEKIELSMIPVVIGVRIKPIEAKKLSPYVGAGVDFYSFKEKARLGNTSGSTTGFHIEGGSYIGLGQRFCLDLNLRYARAEAQPFDEKIGLGGWRAGLGLGYSF
jgi:opacity protein-like surface antigen